MVEVGGRHPWALGLAYPLLRKEVEGGRRALRPVKAKPNLFEAPSLEGVETTGFEVKCIDIGDGSGSVRRGGKAGVVLRVPSPSRVDSFLPGLITEKMLAAVSAGPDGPPSMR